MSYCTLEQNRTGLHPRPKTRAPLACLGCRQRKVRCDVAKNGQPCMNCKLDEKDCVVARRALRCQPRENRENAKSNKRRPSNPDDTQPYHTLGVPIPLFHRSINPVPDAQGDDLAKDAPSATPDFPHGQEKWGGSIWNTFKGRTPSAPGLASTASSNWLSECSTSPSNMVVYCTYTFVARTNVFYVPAREIQYLDSQGCFQLPVPSILDQFVRQYFCHVHPLLPMLSEQDFWDAYSCPNPPEDKTLSLLLIQSMLFASCNCVSLKTINQMGYSSTRSARAAFYRKAKLIYDSGLESSALPVAQAALLLTFWTPSYSSDLKPNTMWLIIAIEHTKRVETDWYSDLSQFEATSTDQHNTLRRLWWCCLIRDRILSLGLRRSIQLLPGHFDFQKNMQLGCLELQSEIHRSRVHSEDSKQGLATVIGHIVRLVVILTRVSLMVFPLSNSIDCLKDASKELEACNEALSTWHEDTRFHRSNRDRMGADTSVHLSITLMHTYYHWAITVICHYTIRSIKTGRLHLSSTSCIFDTFERVRSSTIAIAESLDRLNELGLIQWLPISIVAYAAYPLAAHILDAKCTTTLTGNSVTSEEQKPISEQRLKALMEVMRTLQDQYDGVEQVIKMIQLVVDYAHLHVDLYTTEPDNNAQRVSSNSDLALRVSLAIDWSLSSGRTTDGTCFDSYLARLFRPSNTHAAKTSMVDTHQGGMETNEGQEVTLADLEQSVSDWATSQASMLESPYETTELDPFLGCRDFTSMYGVGHCDQLTADNGFEARINGILGDCGQLDFDDLSILTDSG